MSVVKHGVFKLQPGWASQLLPHGLKGAKKSTRSKSNPTEVGERLEEVQSKEILEESVREVRDDRVWKRKRTGNYWVRLKSEC